MRVLLRVWLAYIGMILLWATTPLAIKLSVEGLGVMWSATSRMTIGFVCMVFIGYVLKKRLLFSRVAVLTYAAVALQIYGAMSVVYWAAQFIPSGWISVISGLTPLVTALLAAVLLKERSLTAGKLLSYLFGMMGLGIMFGSAEKLGAQALLGIVGVLMSISLQALSAIAIKRLHSHLPALTQVTGGLLLALPFYWITWGAFDGEIPLKFSLVSWLCVAYLGVVATPVGFMLYYYLLSQRSATQVSLVTLLSPVLALWLGHQAQGEPITWSIMIGSAFILFALFLHNFFDPFFRAIYNR